MLVMRLQRIGRKHQPSYRLVVAERRSKLDGPPVEDLGSYDPFQKTNTVNQERVKYWLGVGAQPTVTVHNLLVSFGIIEGPKMPVYIKKKKKTASEGEAPKEPAKAEPQASSEEEAKPENNADDESKEDKPAEAPAEAEDVPAEAEKSSE